MNDNVVSTLAPQPKAPEAPAPPRSTTPTAQLNSEKHALFDSIAREGIDSDSETQDSPLKSVFTGLLWFGYSVAIIVAVLLVWSAAKSLLSSIPR
jgi:hypothetical protein